jgi:predicted ester cyclase
MIAGTRRIASLRGSYAENHTTVVGTAVRAEMREPDLNRVAESLSASSLTVAASTDPARAQGRFRALGFLDGPCESEGQMSSEATNKQVVREMNGTLAEYFRGGDMEPFFEFFDDSVVIAVPGMPPNAEGLRQVLPAFQAAFSDFDMEIYDIVAEGDLVAYRVSWTATHTGDLMGIPPTGAALSITESHFERFRDGKIVEHGGDWDQAGMLQQVGAPPAS